MWFQAYGPFELLVNVSDDLLETSRVVNGVSESGRVDDGQSELDASFLNLNRGCVQLHGLLADLIRGRGDHAIGIQVRQEQTVN